MKTVSLIKSPIYTVRSMFLNIKQVQFKNGSFHVNDNKNDAFDSTKLKLLIKNFLENESKWDKSISLNVKDIVNTLHEWTSSTEYEFYCIYYGEEIVGFVSFKLNVKNKPDTAHLRSLYIDDKYRRKGLATQALHRFENAAKSAGKTKLHVFVIEGNKPALNLYKKYGFFEEDQLIIEIEL